MKTIKNFILASLLIAISFFSISCNNPSAAASTDPNDTFSPGWWKATFYETDLETIKQINYILYDKDGTPLRVGYEKKEDTFNSPDRPVTRWTWMHDELKIFYGDAYKFEKVSIPPEWAY